jgi:cardiolipin synthase (CMP-forming)
VAAANAANLLTLARLFCALPIVLLVRAGEYHQAALIFLVAALSDALDGYVAKRFNVVTPLGAVLDPIADKVLMDSLFLTLAFEGHLPDWIALLVIGRDLLIVGGTLLLRLFAGRFRVEPLFLGKASTFLQIALGGAVLAQLSLLPGLAPFVPPLLYLTAALVVASAVAYVHAAGRIWSLARVAR